MFTTTEKERERKWTKNVCMAEGHENGAAPVHFCAMYTSHQVNAIQLISGNTT